MTTLSSFGGLSSTVDQLAAGATGAAAFDASKITGSIPSSAFGAVGTALQGGGALASANVLAAGVGAQIGEAAQKALTGALPGAPAVAGQESGANPVWNFIVAPEDISWDTAVAANRIDIFGTNAPPVIVGTKGMRDLTLSNAMIEGFTRARTVEGRVHALEKLMRFTLNGEKGFVNVPVYKVCANQKEYGNANGEEGGCFVIKDVKIKETMRDLQGKSTRAFADISLIQVPSYQVDTGRDQASATVSAASGLLSTVKQSVPGQAGQNGTGNTSSTAGGSGVPAPAPAPKAAPSASASTPRVAPADPTTPVP